MTPLAAASSHPIWRAPLARIATQTENQRTMNDLPTRVISAQERQATVDRLCAHFAADNLRTAEFESRLDLAYAAQTGAELVALEQDLPELPSDATAGVPAPAPSPATIVDTSRPVSERDFMLSIMGGSERKGNWTPPQRLTVLSVMGGTCLDFRDATFASREVNVSLVAIMGGAEIIVPPGVHVESNGIAIMGGFGREEPGRPVDPGAPVIRINGLVIMGGVEIKERHPGESDREARKRLKAERKAKKLAPPIA